MQLVGIYNGEQTTVIYSATGQIEDYGVSGPTWETVIESTVDVISVEIFGIQYNMSDLPQSMQKSIMDFWSEAVWDYS